MTMEYSSIKRALVRSDRAVRGFVKACLRRACGERGFERVRDAFVAHFKPDSGYDKTYYRWIEDHNRHCYKLFAESVVAEFGPKWIVDVGCGSGGMLQAFIEAGCEGVGFDYSKAAVRLCHQRGLTQVQRVDVRRVYTLPARGDLVISLEVAEHLPGKHATEFCRLLSTLAPVVVMTAAQPGQSGHLHFNEQPRQYWIERMRAAGMQYDGEAVTRLRKRFGGRMISDYDDNLLVYRREKGEARAQVQHEP